MVSGVAGDEAQEVGIGYKAREGFIVGQNAACLVHHKAHYLVGGSDSPRIR